MAVWPFIAAMSLNFVLVLHTIFEVTVYSDLSIDYMNPRDAADKINPYVLPSMGLHGLLMLMLLLTGKWLSLLLNVPLMAWNIKRLLKQDHIIEPTEVFRKLPQHQKESYIRVASFSALFFW
ncbi:cornichon [Protomyces lactucae-debilis]|uniref:Cornichon n=1 Tax=Protomyces lactucae-debilis TaxID=2754530 RepID=A0A1Y2F1B9_PROLT|nr:cornichon [Protomyces lactucae-debilis]ORY77701.1 cornichon [Protomyces lactucae-debilis]